MMFSFRPVFQSGFILKQNMLDALRDYPLNFVNTDFYDMGDGIISGIKISLIPENKFCIYPGIIKFKGEIYFITESTELNFDDGTNFVYLDLDINDKAENNGTIYKLNIISSKEERQDLFEIFRYVKNAKMKKCADIYEVLNSTINRVDLRYAMKSIKGGSTLCDEIYNLFAGEILSCNDINFLDTSFALQCLNEIRDVEIIKCYFKTEDVSNLNIIDLMSQKLSSVRSSSERLNLNSKETVKREPIKKMIIS